MSSNKAITGKNANEIYKTEYPNLEWIIEGIAPTGGAILGARPKTGKSWLTMQVAQSMGDNIKVFNRETAKGKVLYLALEDNERRLKERMRIQKWSEKSRKNVDFVTMDDFKRDIGFLQMKGSAEKLSVIVEKGKYKLVVIDSFNVAFMGLQNIDNNTVVTTAMKPLHNYALKTNILILIIDHHNKSSSGNGGIQSPIDNILGSTAKTSISDTTLGMYKQQKGIARFMAVGRDFEEVDIKICTDENMHWQYDGHGKTTNKENDVFEVLSNTYVEMQLKDIAEALGIPRSRASERLSKLMDIGIVDKSKFGHYYVVSKNGKKH